MKVKKTGGINPRLYKLEAELKKERSLIADAEKRVASLESEQKTSEDAEIVRIVRELHGSREEILVMLEQLQKCRDENHADFMSVIAGRKESHNESKESGENADE